MARIAIIGSGFVGQANGKALVKHGHEVIFSDVNAHKIDTLAREGYRALTPDKLESELVDAFFICVPTPTDEAGVRLDFIQEAAKMLGIGSLRRQVNYPLIIIKSTVPPGTTRGLALPILEQYSGKKAGKDFGIAFEPEFLRERTALQDAEKPRLVLIGTDDQHAGHFLAWLRAPFHCPVQFVSLEAAEFQKYAHNLYNATKITFFNEMRQAAKKLGIDAEAAFSATAITAEASWNPQYGIRDHGPFDGSCLPKDTAGFLRYARDTLHMDLPLLAQVIAVNRALEEEQERVNASLLPEAPLDPDAASLPPLPEQIDKSRIL